MKSFREQLTIFKKSEINLCDIMVASACDYEFAFDYSEDEFERLCAVVKEAYLSAETVDECEIAQGVNLLIKYMEKTVDEVCKMSKWELLDIAVWGVCEEEEN